MTWEQWAKDVQPGDPCEVVWQSSAWPARLVAVRDDGDAEVEINTCADHWLRLVVSWDDVEPPEWVGLED